MFSLNVILKMDSLGINFQHRQVFNAVRIALFFEPICLILPLNFLSCQEIFKKIIKKIEVEKLKKK